MDGKGNRMKIEVDAKIIIQVPDSEIPVKMAPDIVIFVEEKLNHNNQVFTWREESKIGIRIHTTNIKVNGKKIKNG